MATIASSLSAHQLQALQQTTGRVRRARATSPGSTDRAGVDQLFLEPHYLDGLPYHETCGLTVPFDDWD
ncbi:hypothetical protein [Kitasatospora sp. NPDC085464]|uniref:hypothetical protein n=1 Tax=Kitasatospora sp. NPDC085464 TaxID=3364063 RepID=UPI0037C96C29